MAKEEAPAEEAKPKGGSKKLIIIVAIVLVLVLGGAGAFFAMKGKAKPATETAEEETAAEGEEEGGEEGGKSLAPAILPLETFIVNLQVKGSFLKTTIQLEFVTPELPTTVENEVPKVRDSVIRVLSSKSSAEILTPDGKEKLRQELRDAINQALGSDDVAKVYFTEFIIQ